ncbi:MAG: hypothetical protein KGY81_09770, partial [Phycisphaerae bacterium]|nr:hypothetical protein [Phycisphaerae bacterium]
MIAGCSDTTKRDTGKNLRKDTAAARVLYDQAQGLLSNPYIEGETVRLHAEPEQALTLLQKAESVLTTSISENYEQVKSQGGDSSTVSKTDAAAAYYVRGLVHQLASDYYAWTAKRDVEEARQAARRGQDILGDIQQANAGALEYQAVAAMTNVELDKRIAKAKKEAAAARKTVQTIKGQISEAEKRIAALQEQIEADSFKAATLRAESEQLPTEEGREKLKQAWTYRDKVHEANEEIDTLEETILQHRARLKEAEHKRAGAEGKLEGLAAVAKEQDRVAQGNTTKFNTQKQTVSQRAGELATAMKNAGESAAAARALIGQAEGRL